MERAKLSLKGLEVFLAVSRRGVLSDASRDLGISVSTASHHLSELERSIGTALFDHARRPMKLTAAGGIMRKRAEEALGSLGRGISEIWSDDIQSLVRLLRLAMIEDFDADVAPALTQDLVRKAPRCDVSLLSRPTHEILELLQSGQIDLGVATTADFDGTGLTETPLLRDPFVLLLPAERPPAVTSLADLMSMSPQLPFLRYSSRQLLGQRIEAQLRRLDVQFPKRMEFETTHVILSLVAAGHGWTVTTALSFARAQRYHSQLSVRPFPGRAFAREISVFVREDVPAGVVAMTIASLRRSILRMIIDPTVARYPWLSDQFLLADRSAAASDGEIRPTESGTGP